MTYTVTLPGSEHYVLTANDRSHWSVHSDTRRYWRGLARLLFKGKPHYQRARVTVTFRFPDRRRRDVANLHPYVIKPILDGMVDAGVLPDDDDEHLVGPDPRRCPERGPFQVSVTVEEL